ncbi:MAG: hypothetical protein JWM53_2080 [bacterium]|nr:hypothetical protein [bacterium]
MPRLFALLLLLSAACRTPPLDYDGGVPGGNVDMTDGHGRDLAAPRTRDLAGIPTSCCGKAGNPGNEFGVGKFCQDSLDCVSIKATICASTFAPNLTFCTMSCTMNGGNAQCGSGAQCQCANGQCACVPGECTMPPPGC